MVDTILVGVIAGLLVLALLIVILKAAWAPAEKWKDNLVFLILLVPFTIIFLVSFISSNEDYDIFAQPSAIPTKEGYYIDPHRHCNCHADEEPNIFTAETRPIKRTTRCKQCGKSWGDHYVRLRERSNLASSLYIDIPC
jgi:hypothetical protein